MKKIMLAALASVLSACGGGGDNAPQGTTQQSFQLLEAYKAFVAKGDARSFSISGSCGGSGNRSTASAKGGSAFEGVAALSAITTMTLTLTGCTPTSSAQTSTSYYDQGYLPLGEVVSGGAYGVYSAPVIIPATVSVGSTGLIGTVTKYTDSTKAKVTCGTTALSYVIEPDTQNTVIVNLIQKDFELPRTGQPLLTGPSTTCASLGPILTSTAQSRFRLNADANLTPISTDIQNANGSTVRLVFTYN